MDVQWRSSAASRRTFSASMDQWEQSMLLSLMCDWPAYGWSLECQFWRQESSLSCNFKYMWSQFCDKSLYIWNWRGHCYLANIWFQFNKQHPIFLCVFSLFWGDNPWAYRGFKSILVWKQNFLTFICSQLLINDYSSHTSALCKAYIILM